MTDIFKAIKRNNIKLVKECIDSGADLNEFRKLTLYESKTPLWYAIDEKCDIKLIELLLSYGARSYDEKISICGFEKYDIRVRSKLVKLLLSYGATIKPKSNYFDYLNYNEDIDFETLKLLVFNGANVNLKNKEGETLLDTLIDFYYKSKYIYPSVKLLIEHGAKVDIKTKYCSFYEDHKYTDHHDEIKGTLLHKAIIYSEDCQLISLLLKSGIDVNTKDEEGKTPLICAVRSSHPSIIKLLLSHGADVNATDNFGRTALFYYIRYIESAELLIKHGIDINHQDNDGNTVLHYYFNSIRNNIGEHHYRRNTVLKEQVINLLLEQDNIDLTIKDNDGNTVIESATSILKVKASESTELIKMIEN